MNARKPFLLLLILSFFFQHCGPSKTKEEKGPDPEDSRYAEHVRTSEYQTPEEEMAGFVLPEGFEVTLFASEPDITKPINMAFDEKGRLWVSQSSEYPVAAGPNEGTDRITILEDTDGDGRADVITDFADDLNIPIGIMPIKNGAIAYSIPNIYRFTDTDGDDRADKREVLLGEFEHLDTHGMVNNMFRGFDGWMHASHGFSNISVVAGSDGDSVRFVSGNTFRFRMDGSRVEKTSDGRINPFGSDYDEMGYHYSADCHTLPIFQLIWGGNYSQWGKREPNMGFAPTMMDYGLNSTALSGLVYYTDNQFPEEYQNSFYSGDVVTCRISRNTIEFQGSTPTATRQEDFLVSKDPWFRPVDIKIGPDGAMYVADFYNRIIGHYEVPLDHPGRDRVSGRIWKIAYKGNQREVVDWSNASMGELVEGIGHEVLDTRMRATDELVDRMGKEAVAHLENVVSDKAVEPVKMIQALWALYRLDALPSTVLKSAMDHDDERVQVHALRILAEYEGLEAEQISWAVAKLQDKNPHVQRAAAELLSRHPRLETYRPLIELYHQVPDYDTHLQYTIKLAISNHFSKDEIVKRVVAEEWEKDQANLIALVISDVPSSYSANYLLEHLTVYDQPEERQRGFVTSIARSLPMADIGRLIEFVKQESASNPDLQYKLAIASQQGMEQRGGDLPLSLREWYVELATAFLNQMPEASGWTEEMRNRQKYAAETAERFRVKGLEKQLQVLFETVEAGEDVRVTAANALMSIAPEQNAQRIADVLYDGAESVGLRQRLAGSLGRSNSATVRSLLGEGLRGAPTEVQEGIATVLANTTEGIGYLMDLIGKGYAPARLLKARGVEENLLKNIGSDQRETYEALTSNIEPVSEEKQRLIDERMASFDPAGKTVEGGKALYQMHCGICHQVDNEGGLIGPQLDGIGNWGRSALTVKILDPNRNITENFRNYNITLKNGQTVTGLFRREEGQSLVFANQLGEEFSVAKDDIQEQTASKYTLMPDSFDKVMTPDEFDELMVYLLSIR